jgi:hypothetical protein
MTVKKGRPPQDDREKGCRSPQDDSEKRNFLRMTVRDK